MYRFYTPLAAALALLTTTAVVADPSSPAANPAACPVKAAKDAEAKKAADAKPAEAKKDAKDTAKEQRVSMEQRVLHLLRCEDSAKYDALMKLRKENPARFKEQLEQLLAENQKKIDAFNALVKSYRNKPDPAVKKQIMEQMSHAYDIQTRWKKSRLDKAEADLKKQREDYLRQVDRRDKELGNQWEKLTGDRAQQW